MGPLKLGTTLTQKYRITRLLAESGGVVLYEANDVARKQRVWVRILARESLANAEALERFKLEASRATVLDVGKEAGLPYMVASELAKDAADAPHKPPPPAYANPKSTLPGVAPPPARMPRPLIPREEPEDEESPPSSSIPVSADDLLVDSTPSPDAVTLPLMPPSAPSAKPAALRSAKPPAPRSAKPPPVAQPTHEIAPIEMAAPAIATPQMPSLPPMRSLIPTLPPDGELVVRRDQKKPSNAKWFAALGLVACAAGFGGWYLGRHESPPATIQATTATTVTSVAAATPPPTPTTETAAATTTAAPSATATGASTQTIAEVAVAPVARPTTETETAPTSKPGPVRSSPPRPHKPPPARAGGGDPLTL